MICAAFRCWCQTILVFLVLLVSVARAKVPELEEEVKEDCCSCLWSLAYAALAILFLSLWKKEWWATQGPLREVNRLSCLYHLWQQQKQLPHSLPNFSILNPIEHGLLSNQAEIDLEQPRLTTKKGSKDDEDDEFHLRCVNERGAMFCLEFKRRIAARTAVARIVWREKWNGETLSTFNSTEFDHSKGDVFKAGGLTLTVLEPFRRWRVVFNGLMKRESNGDVVHVRINCIWSALSKPFDWAKDSSLRPLAETAADANVHNVSQLKKMSFDFLHGIDQYGALFGQVAVDEEDEKEIYVRGLRRRDCVVTAAQESTFIGVSDSGFHFALKLGEFQGKSLTSGHIYIPGTALHSMTDISFPVDIRSMVETWRKQLLRPQQVFVRFKAGNRWFNVGIVLTPRRHKMGDSCTLIPTDITFNASRGTGFFIISERSEDEDNKIHPPRMPYLLSKQFPPTTIAAELSLAVSLHDSQCCNSEISGGKGASLAQLMQSKDLLPVNVKVPSGICVSVAGFERHLQLREKVRKALEKVEEVVYKRQQCQDEVERRKCLQEACDSAVTIVTSTPIEDSVRTSIISCLDSTFAANSVWRDIKFAVRSSACGEDSEELSAAGQNETFLGCMGEDNIMEAIKKCWASLYTFQSVEYRRQNGQPVRTGMSVVIQEMVAADAAGVMFSRDPVTGNPSKVVITANYGLGESVVSAMSEPDTVVVSYQPWKSSDEVWLLQERKIGSKKTKVVMSEINFTAEEMVDPTLSSVMCMSDPQALQLAKLAVLLEEDIFGAPRDVEFALKSNKEKTEIFLLQARPITAINAWTDEELLHEFDSAVSSANSDVRSTANVGEVLSGAVSPMSQSVLLKTLDLGIQARLQSNPVNKMQFNPYALLSMPTSHQHIFLNYLDCCLMAVSEEEINTEVMACDLAVCGHQVCTREDIAAAIERRGVLTRVEKARKMLSLAKGLVVSVLWQKTDWWNKCKEALFPDLQSFSQLSSADILKSIRSSMPNVYEVVHNHSQITEAGTAFQLIVFLTLAENAPAEEWSNDLYSDSAVILTSTEEMDVVSAGVPDGLKALARAVMQCPDVQEFAEEASPDKAEEWLHRQSNNVASLYRHFVDKFQYRCWKELDFVTVPWGENRTPLIQTLQASVKGNLMKSETTKDKNQVTFVDSNTLDAKLECVSKPLKEGTKKALRFLAPLAVGGVALREKSKFAVVQRVGELRLALRELGKALRREGKLPEEQLVFYLTLHEARQLVAAASSELVQKAVRRQRLASKWEDLKFEEMNHGIPKPISQQNSYSHSVDPSGETVVKGTSVCRGTCIGVARVVTKLADANTIQQGDVLVTTCTDIGWSPYFPLLGGVVTEIGGLISHGAVVAREYGLPCVVGATNATFIFKTGDVVEIDGRQGTVRKCRESS